LRTAATSASALTEGAASTNACSVAKFTLTSSTPGTDFSDFSTRTTQLAQVKPVTWSLRPLEFLGVVAVEFMTLLRAILSE